MTQSPTKRQQRRLRAHFSFTKIPFHKSMWAKQMYDSASQRELYLSLEMSIDLHGVMVVVGQSGVGKSITLRRFISELDEARFHVIRFTYLPTTTVGFLRSLSRALGLPMRLHGADLFDAAQQHLVTFQQEHGRHPLLVVDDAEGLPVAVFDVLRRLTAFDLDAEEHFSMLISGTEDMLHTLRHPTLDTLRSRVAYTHGLRPFSLEDTRNYVRFHLERAEADPKIFSDDAIQKLFQASSGRPRYINQLALQALIQAAVMGRSTIDGRFMTDLITNHPFYQQSQGD
jgi:type II secretory pathway predicted ATPase ExeA